MPREVDIRKHIEQESSDEGMFGSGIKRAMRKNNSPLPRRTLGTSKRDRIIDISDSESDSDLPSPSLLLQHRKVVRPTSNIGSLIATDEIIDISSDSEIEATPTKPRSELPSSAHGHPASTSESASISALTNVFHNSFSLAANDTLDQAHSTSRVRPDKSTASSQSTDPGSTVSEEADETRLFDQSVYHPGILHFDPGPRKPALITSHSTTSISTHGVSDSSQDLCGEGGKRPTIRTHSPSGDCLDDSSEDAKEIESLIRSPKPKNTIGASKATSSGSGYRSRVRADISKDAAPPQTPRPRPKPKARSAALISAPPPTPLSPKPTPRNQGKLLQASALNLFAELNESVFGWGLPKDCPIEWSKKLNTTAGRAHWKRIRDVNGNVSRHETRIELSTKVVDCEERVRNTLSHEMCHLAAWIFDSEMKPPHGPAFKRWSDRIMEARPDITISIWEAQQVDRSGKASKLVPQFETAPKRTPFQDYLKTHMKDFKAANPGMQHGEAMRRLGEMFRAEKEAAVDEELDQVMAGMTRLGINSLTK